MLHRLGVLLVGFVILSGSQKVFAQDQFPIIFYWDPTTGVCNLANIDAQFDTLADIGATHVIGWGNSTVAQKAKQRNIKVFAGNDLIKASRAQELCLPYCSTDDSNFWVHNMVKVSDVCPKYLELLTNWGYKTDFEVEEKLIGNSKGYAFLDRATVTSPATQGGATGWLSVVSNHQSGYMFTGPINGSHRHFSPKGKDTLWCNADFALSVGDISGDPNTVVAKLVVVMNHTSADIGCPTVSFSLSTS